MDDAQDDDPISKYKNMQYDQPSKNKGTDKQIITDSDDKKQKKETL